MKKITTIVSLAFCLSSAGSFADDASNKRIADELRAYYNSMADHRSHEDFNTPKEIQKGLDALSQANIPTFKHLTDLAAYPEMSAVIVQEFLRKDAANGMPWLPLSWSTEHMDAESINTTIVNSMETNIRNLKHPLSDDNLFLVNLYVGSIFHMGSVNYVNNLRAEVEQLAQADRGFLDIRLEIHQEPSLQTIEKVKEYIKTATGSNRTTAEHVLSELQVMFGSGSTEAYLQTYAPAQEYVDVLNSYQRAMTDLQNVSKARELEDHMDSLMKTMTDLADRSLAASKEIRNGASGYCTNNMTVDCNYKWVDLLRQLQTGIFIFGSTLQERIDHFHSNMSLHDFYSLAHAYVIADISAGLSGEDLIQTVDEAIQKQAAPANATLLPSQVVASIQHIDDQTGRIQARVRGIFGAVIDQYKGFIPSIGKRLTDDTIRSTPLVPLENLTASMYASLAALSKLAIQIGDREIHTAYRNLNAGIAHGKLVIATEAMITNDDYDYDGSAIYFLPKTPAELKKVAGILTADSGSIISHVNLLAANHGLPNIFVPLGFREVLRQFEGKDVLVVALPNGEARIKLWANATPDEIQVYKDYNKVKESKRIGLVVPPELENHTKPMLLEQLGLKDRGILAGGKACGQGEMAQLAIPGSIFDRRVPRAIVLPFGVYHQTMKDSGILQYIHDTFQQQDIKGDDDESHKRRSEALASVRQKINQVRLKPELVTFLAELLKSPPFADEMRDHGVYVRSDTNAEDLPGFVGAGLNDTVPNVVGLDNVLAAIKSVWASPFTEKAFTWRKDLIMNPWDIFPSVLIQIGMPSEKAGIMVVGSPTEDEADDTVLIAGNEGLGITAVNGEYSPEEIVVSRKNGWTAKRVTKAYARTKKIATADGHVKDVPSEGLDPLFTPDNISTLAHLGDAIQKHVAATKGGKLEKWDLEWSIVGDKVMLVQLRVYNGNGIVRDVASLRRLATARAAAKETAIMVNDRTLTLQSLNKMDGK